MDDKWGITQMQVETKRCEEKNAIQRGFGAGVKI